MIVTNSFPVNTIVNSISSDEIIDRDYFVTNYLRLPSVSYCEYETIEPAIDIIEKICGIYIRLREVTFSFNLQPAEMVLRKGKLHEFGNVYTVVSDNEVNIEDDSKYKIYEASNGFRVVLLDSEYWESTNRIIDAMRIDCSIGYTLDTISTEYGLIRTIYSVAAYLYLNRNSGIGDNEVRNIINTVKNINTLKVWSI